MADPTITATQIDHISGPTFTGELGATGTRGQAVYRDSVTGKLLLAISTNAATAKAVGVLLSDGSDKSYVLVAGPGAIVDFGAGAAIAAGKIYIVSSTAGAHSPHTDATTPATGEYCTITLLGIGNNRALVVCAASDVAAA